MKPWLSSRRRLIDLGILAGVSLVLFLIFQNPSFVALFAMGFIWNWTASQDLNLLFESRRSRFSTLKLVVNVQNLFLKPFTNSWVKIAVGILPAGIFWCMVIAFNESEMPWYATFLGSLFFEVINLKLKKPEPAA